MTKAEYLSAFGRELKRLGVADAGDVLEEYEQHFEFKGRDGCTEEEISARLGDPAALAAQFAGTGTASGSGALTAVGLGFMWIFAALFFVLLAAWAAVMAAFAIACAACAVCLAVGVDAGGIIPDMPYYCALLYALALAALSVLSAVGTVYYALFVRAVVRAWARFAHNTLASARGGAALPALPVAPSLPAARARRARRVALAALAVFAACFVLGAVVSMLSAGGIQFWHAWHWFGYGA